VSKVSRNPGDAADNYKTAAKLYEQARQELYQAVRENGEIISVSGIARRAGLHPQTLYDWIRNEGVSKRGK
jgi:transposase-like protein